MRRRWRDALVLAAVAAVAIAAAADALRPRSSPAAEALPPVAAPQRIALRGSPETAFLRPCETDRLELAVAPGPAVVLRYSGPPCQLAGLDLRAVVRNGAGAVVYRGAATELAAFARNLAGRQEVTAALLPRTLPCRAQMAFMVDVQGAGLAASGAVRCRGEF